MSKHTDPKNKMSGSKTTKAVVEAEITHHYAASPVGSVYQLSASGLVLLEADTVTYLKFDWTLIHSLSNVFNIDASLAVVFF